MYMIEAAATTHTDFLESIREHHGAIPNDLAILDVPHSSIDAPVVHIPGCSPLQQSSAIFSTIDFSVAQCMFPIFTIIISLNQHQKQHPAHNIILPLTYYRHLLFGIAIEAIGPSQPKAAGIGCVYGD